MLDAALEHARPVYLEIPRDMPSAPCGEVPARALPEIDPDRLAACADGLVQRLAGARQPVLMVGVEVRRYGLEAKVAELAQRLRVPMVTNVMGQGLMAGQDVSDTNFAVSAKRIDIRHAIHVYDGNVAMGHHVYQRIPIAALVDALLERLPVRAATASREPRYAAAVEPPAIDDAGVTPHDIAMAINDLMRRHGSMPIACDVGDCLFTSMEIQATPLIAAGYYAGMGYPVPASIGLQASTGQRPLVLVGDGAFQMTGWESGNAARCGCDPIVLVFNNASWEMLRAFDPEASFNDLRRWDFASMAAGMGGDGHTARTRAELVVALERTHATRGRFQLIDVRIEAGVRSPTLQRFVAAVKRQSMPG